MAETALGGLHGLPAEQQTALHLFRRQYLQLLDPRRLAVPDATHLRHVDAQQWLFDQCFDTDRNTQLPSARYRLRTLKLLVSKIERAIVDPDEHTVLDALVESLTVLISRQLPSEAMAQQEKDWVTYTCLFGRSSVDDSYDDEPAVVLREHRNLISGAGTTGLRTWEAALHLGSYLLEAPDSRALVAGKNILELGAGSGFLSILCAKHIGVGQMVATDGDGQVVEVIKENTFINGVDDCVTTTTLWWGQWPDDNFGGLFSRTVPLEVVIGADVTYDKAAIPALIATLRTIFAMWPTAMVLISATIRNEDTFETFELGCAKSHFIWTEIEWSAAPLDQQTHLFHAVDVPIRIVKIEAAKTSTDPFAVG